MSNKCTVTNTVIKKRRVQSNGCVQNDKITITTKCEGYDNPSTVEAQVRDGLITIEDIDHDQYVILSFSEIEVIYNFYKGLQDGK